MASLVTTMTTCSDVRTTDNVDTMKKFFNQDDKLLGVLHDDGIFRKIVSCRKHLFKNDNAWGIDRAVVNDLPAGTEIRIKDTDDGTVYITTIERFKSGSLIDYGKYGAQIVFWRGFFDTMKDGIPIKNPFSVSYYSVEQWIEDLTFFEAYIPGSSKTI